MNDTAKIIDIVTDEIISSINPSWNKLQKIRFVYLSLGKYLEKNTDFFLNDKLDSLSLSKKEMDDIYFNNNLYVSNNKLYQITCKSAAEFLKTAFEKLGIEHSLVHTTGNDEDILHYFVVAKDDNGNQYFLTLAADLPYIKNNLPTMHFANNIAFIDSSLNQIYVLPDNPNIDIVKSAYIFEDGVIHYVDEIKHTVLCPNDLESLRKIDETIGFGKLYESIDLLKNKDFQQLFYIQINDGSNIYKIFRKSFNINDEYAKRADDITKKEIDKYKTSMIRYISQYIKKKGFSFNSSTYFKDTIIELLKIVNVIDIDEKLTDRELLTKYKKDLKQLKDTDYYDILISIQTMYAIFDKFDTFYSDKTNQSENLQNSKKDISIVKLKPLLDRLAYTELKEKLTVKTHEYLPLDYIVTKFNLIFPVVFDCNFKKYKTLNQTSFSIQGYSEQIVIIKEFLKRIFSELTEQNCADIDDYNRKYTPVENRIKTFPLKDKKTGEYCIGFDFGGKDEENTVNYMYIPSKNLLRKRDPIADLDKYWIVSERFNKKLKKIEDIEIEQTKKPLSPLY